MSKPLWFSAKTLQTKKKEVQEIVKVLKKSNIHFFAIALIIFAAIMNLWDYQTTSYAHAFTGENIGAKISSPIFDDQNINLFDVKANQDKQILAIKKELSKEVKADGRIDSSEFANKIYEMVGETPIREMVPFISVRDEKVAAFLVGIAKKESSFGLQSPSKDGKTCYNYWGYKGEGTRGVGMGYACFGSPEEAVKVVGDKLQSLVEKERNTPARMVDTWKCGRSCAGDSGAPGWVATVASYFEKLVG